VKEKRSFRQKSAPRESRALGSERIDMQEGGRRRRGRHDLGILCLQGVLLPCHPCPRNPYRFGGQVPSVENILPSKTKERHGKNDHSVPKGSWPAEPLRNARSTNNSEVHEDGLRSLIRRRSPRTPRPAGEEKGEKKKSASYRLEIAVGGPAGNPSVS